MPSSEKPKQRNYQLLGMGFKMFLLEGEGYFVRMRKCAIHYSVTETVYTFSTYDFTQMILLL